MAIVVDTRNNGASGAGVVTLSWSHTVNKSIGNSILVGLASTGSASPPLMSSCVWDDGGENTSLSKTVNGVTAEQLSGGSGFARASWWYLSAPASGTKTIKFTAASSCELAAGSASYGGVSQAASFNGASPQKVQFAADTNPSTAMTSAIEELVVDVVSMSEAADTGPGVAGSGQTQIFQQDVGTEKSIGFGSDESGAATVTMSWTGIAVNNLGSAQIVVSLIPAPLVAYHSPAHPSSRGVIYRRVS